MSILLIDDEYVLLPNQPDVSELPRCRPVWRTVTGGALTGTEERVALRGQAWKELTFRVDGWTQAERARLEDRIRAALKTGRAASPLWGRGGKIASALNAGDALITLSTPHRTWTTGEYLFIQRSNPTTVDEYELLVVAGVEGSTLLIDGEITLAYPAGTFVWPLHCGKFTCESFSPLGDVKGAASVTITSQSETLVGEVSGTPYVPGEGGEDFEEYDLGSISAFGGGSGLIGAAAVILGSAASVAEETFESYALGDAGDGSGLDEGTGCDGAAAIIDSIP